MCFQTCRSQSPAYSALACLVTRHFCKVCPSGSEVSAALTSRGFPISRRSVRLRKVEHLTSGYPLSPYKYGQAYKPCGAGVTHRGIRLRNRRKIARPNEIARAMHTTPVTTPSGQRTGRAKAIVCAQPIFVLREVDAMQPGVVPAANVLRWNGTYRLR